MSAISLVQKPHTVKHNRRLSVMKIKPQSYPPWRTPFSDRQLNTAFESQIIPGITHRLEHAFADLAEDEREEAVQDATCQALEAYRLLRLGEYQSQSHSADDMVFVLATFVSTRYQNGVRFASTRSATLQ